MAEQSMKDKAVGLMNNVKYYWKEPPNGKYMPFKEVAAYAFGGIGAYFIIQLGSTLIVSTTNIIVSTAVGVDPTHSYIIYLIATILNVPLTAVRANMIDNTGAFGGIIPSLRKKGVPPIITTDGPAGIRIKQYTSLIPCGTALASTFNCALIEALTTVTGRELAAVGSDVLLAPGMNIQRNVLCGRNFEYFSEDPLLSGKMGAAYIRGVQKAGASACPKHFACNNQETHRTRTDSRISQRALREIYLKGFEIAVKEGKPLNIMTSYNKINGVWSHYNYDLVTTVLRGEWGYDGCVMTDWWMQKSASPEFPKIKDNAYRVRAQVDVLMPGGKYGTKRYVSDGTLLSTLGEEGGITRAELERTAKNVLRLALKIQKH